MKMQTIMMPALVILTIATPAAYAQDVLWVRQMAGIESLIVDDTAVDAAGNVYTSGQFEGTVDFDPGAGVFELTSAGGGDAFIAKFDAAGNFVWARGIGGADPVDDARGVEVQGGYVYASGTFVGTVDFDPGPGVHEMTSGGYWDTYVLKLDAAGDLVWARQLSGGSHGQALAVDGNGDAYAVGYFYGTVDFDPGPAVFSLTTAGSEGDIYAWKLDSAGNLAWAAQLEGPAAFSEVPHDVRIAANGDVLVGGRFQTGAVDFDPGPGVFNLTPLGRDGFVVRLDSAGNFVWAKSFGSTSSSTLVYGMALGGGDDVYLTGYCIGVTVDFDPGPGAYNLDCGRGVWDIFVSKLDGTGAFQWAATMGASTFDIGFGVAVDGSDRAHFTGYFAGTVDFDPGPGVFNLTSAGLRDGFLLTLDGSDGGFVRALHLGRGVDNVYPDSITLGLSDNIHVGGGFRGTVDFDPGPGAIDLTSAGEIDAFVWKYGVPEPEPCDPDPLPQGYWHRQCISAGLIGPGNHGRGPQGILEPGFVDVLVPAVDAWLQETVYVSRTCEDGIDAVPPGDKCEQALRAYTTLLLNIESGRLQESCAIDLSSEGCSATNIGALVDELAGLINGGHTDDCRQAVDCANVVNEDQGIISIPPPPPQPDRIDPIGAFEPVQQAGTAP